MIWNRIESRTHMHKNISKQTDGLINLSTKNNPALQKRGSKSSTYYKMIELREDV